MGNGALYMEDEEKIKDQIQEMLDCLWNEDLLIEFAFGSSFEVVIKSILEVLKPYIKGKK